MNGPDKATNDRSSPAAVLVALAVVLLPVVYVLSTGPMVWLLERGCIPEAALDIVYWPLEMLCRNCEPVGQFFEAYLRLWGRQ